MGLAIDNEGCLFVADTVNHLIRKVSSQGLVTTFAESGDHGSADGQDTVASFNEPIGLAIDGDGNHVVANNHRIRVISPSGGVWTIAGNGQSGSKYGIGRLASFHYPHAVAIDSNGGIMVSA